VIKYGVANAGRCAWERTRWYAIVKEKPIEDIKKGKNNEAIVDLRDI